MPLSNSLLAYEDIQKLLDQALESEIGLSVTFLTHGGAIGFRQRCYKFRRLSHKMSEEAFDEGDIRFGTSIYDTLTLKIREKVPGEPWVVDIRKSGLIKYDVRELKV